MVDHVSKKHLSLTPSFLRNRRAMERLQMRANEYPPIAAFMQKIQHNGKCVNQPCKVRVMALHIIDVVEQTIRLLSKLDYEMIAQ